MSPNSTLYCQKCRQPLDPDTTVEDLNPASFDVLVASTGRAQQSTNTRPHLNYPQERKALYDRVSSQTNPPVYKRSIPAPQDASTADLRSASGQGPRSGAPDMSFIEITQSQAILPERDSLDGVKTSPKGPKDGDKEKGGKKDPMSGEIEKAQVLYEILSSRSDIDHPICAECAALLLASFNARLASANRERDSYASFLKSIQQTASATQVTSQAKTAKASKDAQNALESTFGHLKLTEDQSEAVEKEIGDLEEETEQADREEQAYWTARNAIDDRLHETTIRLFSLQEKYAHDRQQLERLQRTNVYNDTFCISHDGSFGTINGLRLGRLPGQNVDWAEINAAWGQAILLLATVAERLKFSFQGYRLKPQGSTSRIEKLEYPQQSPNVSRQSVQDRGSHQATGISEPKITILDLFSSGDMAIGRLLNHRRFDNGMVAFLDCIDQLAKYVQRTSKVDLTTKTNTSRNASARTPKANTILPYEIQDDRIGNVSIKLGVGFHQDENFTKACKYALTCCKYLLAYVSNLEVQGLTK